MGLVIKKAKRDTVSYCVLGVGLIGIVTYLLFGPLIWFISSKQREQIPISVYPGLIIGALLIYISMQLKKDNSWIAKRYERLGPGTLLIILLISVWFFLPAVGAIIEYLTRNI